MRTNYPVNDENTLYISLNYEAKDLVEILQEINNHFGHLGGIEIEIEHRHVEALGYDRYDSGDYHNYLVVRRTGA